MSSDRDVQATLVAGEGRDSVVAAPPQGAVLSGEERARRYLAVRYGPDFVRLRSRSRRHLAAMAAVCLGPFTATAALAAAAPGVLATAVLGPADLGAVLAAVSLAAPVPATVVHLRRAGRRLDPLARKIREEFPDPPPPAAPRP